MIKMKTRWKAFLSIFRISLAESLQYRAASLAGSAVSVFWALIEITVYIVFYRYANNASAISAEAGMTLRQVVSYVWLGQFVFLMQQMAIDGDILQKITNGDIGVELCRPLPLYDHWCARTASSRLAPLVWRGGVVLLAGIFMPIAGYRMSAPASFAHLAASLCALVGSFLLCTIYGMFVTTVRMNVDWGNGPSYIMMLIPSVLSGTYLPLQLWPAFLQKFLILQPFAGYADLPLRLYVGTLRPIDAVWAVGLQLFWSLLFLVAGRRLMKRNLKYIVVQGG